MRLYSIVIAPFSTVRHSNVLKISHQFQSMITETVKVHDAVVPFCVLYLVSIRPPSHRPDSRFRFHFDALRSSVTCYAWKKYGTCIRLASSFNYTLVVMSDFYRLSGVFFFFVATLCPRLYGIQFATLFHRAIMTLQLFELTSRSFAVIYRFCHTDRSADQRPERAQQTETVTHLLVSVSKSAFSSPFSSSSSPISCPCLGLSSLPRQQLRWLARSSRISRDDAS